MSTQGLKENILDDIERIKTLDLPIMDAGEQYKQIGLLILKIALLFMFGQYLTAQSSALMVEHYVGHLNGFDLIAVPFRETLYFGTMVTLAFSFFFFPSMASKYVIFQTYYRKNLKSGEYIQSRIRFYQRALFNFYFIVCFITSLLCQGSLLAGNGIAFLLSIFFTNFLLSTEFERIGIPNLYAAFNQIITKQQGS